MTGFTPHIGSALLMPSGDKLHLFVIVTGQSANGDYLLVSISSQKEGRYHDPTCEIAAGVHAFVRLPSFAFYGGAQEVSAQRLTAMVAKGVYVAKADMPKEIIQRICDGIETSIHTPRFAKNAYRTYKRSLGKL